MLDNLIKYIKSVTVNGKEVSNNGNNIEIKKNIGKYSSSKVPTINLELNNIKLKRTDKVTYECPKCHEYSTIGIGRFLGKKTEYCYKCKEQSPDKRKNHSEYIKKSYSEYNKVVALNKNDNKPKSIEDLVKDSLLMFDNECDDFKLKYFERTPTLVDFEKIRDKIKSISGNNILNKDIKYYPIVKNTNQMKYSPKVLIDDKLVLLSNCELICDICDTIFSGRNIKEKANKKNVLCPSCSFSNDIFKFKFFLNINSEKVVYQSKPELTLLKYCNENNILIKNGPRVKYIFNGGEKIYKVDFEIPKFKQIVEIKDSHIWHKNQVESGQWTAKENAAKKWAQSNDYEFNLIFNVIDIINILNMKINEKKFIKNFINFSIKK